MNRVELEAYLERLGLRDTPRADADGLALVQRAHLETVPFENLDIASGRLPLALDEAALFDKIVRRRRGGICYELNLLFAAALRALGFSVVLRGGRHPKYGDDMDHLFLEVLVPDDDVPRMADVGFAANFANPLRLAAGEVQDDGRDRYLIEEAPETGEGYLRLMRMPGLAGAVEAGEMFTFGPRRFAPEDCRSRCDWFCTAPESRFTQGPLVTIDSPGGRKTLSARHFIETRDGVRTSVDLKSPDEFDRYLFEAFGMRGGRDVR